MTKPPSPPPSPAGSSPSAAALARLLAFNGIDATTGEYLLPSMNVSQLARVATGGRIDGDELTELQRKSRGAKKTSFAVVEGVDPNNLAQAGWAVVFPHAADPAAAARQAAVRDALAPLLAHRRAAATAGGADLYREYIGELAYRADETKQQYLARLGAGPGPARPSKVPYYLLLVATPEEIPYRIQYQLDVHYAVGRIAFDTLEEYARYATSVVDAETGRVSRPRRAAFFGVANTGDASTQVTADHLVMPLAEHVEGRYEHLGWTVDSHLAEVATRDCLVGLLRDPPTLLFSATHGMGFPCGDPGQRERQGALLCQDWPGPGNPIAREHYLAAEDLPAGADLRGMIAVLFACYGGGTPQRDEFARRALGEAHAKELTPSPMIARLPQRMLAHPPGGALAVVAHVDRAWGSTFLWIDAQGKSQTQKHLDVFESMIDSLLAGKRLGYAMEAFNLRYAELAADLSERIEQIQLYESKYEESELAHMWIYNNDARNYAVIGDPAVCLANAREPARAEAGSGPSAASGPSQATPSQAATNVPAPSAPASAGPPQVEGDPLAYSPSDPERAELLEALRGRLGDVLGKALDAAVVLEVATYTGGDPQAVAAGESLPARGARLFARTRCELGGDVEVYLPEPPADPAGEALWSAHSEAVKQAQAHRTELLERLLALLSPGARR